MKEFIGNKYSILIRRSVTEGVDIADVFIDTDRAQLEKCINENIATFHDEYEKILKEVKNLTTKEEIDEFAAENLRATE